MALPPGKKEALEEKKMSETHIFMGIKTLGQGLQKKESHSFKQGFSY